MTDQANEYNSALHCKPSYSRQLNPIEKTVGSAKTAVDQDLLHLCRFSALCEDGSFCRKVNYDCFSRETLEKHAYDWLNLGTQELAKQH